MHSHVIARVIASVRHFHGLVAGGFSGCAQIGAGTVGLSCLSADESSLGYGKEGVGFWIISAERPVADDPKSGLHFCFAAPSRQSVAAFYAAAMAHGGRDNGKPGVRKDYGPQYYAAFVFDPEGYRLEAYHGGK